MCGQGDKLSLSLGKELSFGCELEVGGIEIRLSSGNLAGSLVADGVLSFKGGLGVSEVILESAQSGRNGLRLGLISFKFASL